MSNQVLKKIVITGGPCSGKTTGLPRIREHFERLGWKVIVVSETATQVITGGFRPGTDEIGNVDFQELIMSLQIHKEQCYEQAAKALRRDKVLILYDRGTLDCRGYMNSEEFEVVTNHVGVRANALRGHYTAVFHLVTAADGAAEFYTVENNEARRERGLEEAIEADILSRAAWVGHNHLRIIENPEKGGFDQKMKNLIDGVAEVLGEPTFEIERKFLIEMPDLAALMANEKLQCHMDEIVQTYLVSEPDLEVRVRARGHDGDWSYTKTTKKGSGIRRVELEDIISKEQYRDELNEAKGPVDSLTKMRYVFLYRNQCFEIDVYPNIPDLQGFAIMEIELSREDQAIELPDFITVRREITGKKHFSNAEIAQLGARWRPLT
jgi:CYTH domain-containing protein/predicted ATPase